MNKQEADRRRAREWRLANLDRAAAHQADYRRRNPEAVARRNREWRLKTPDYYERNRESRRRAAAAFRARNPDIDSRRWQKIKAERDIMIDPNELTGIEQERYRLYQFLGLPFKTTSAVWRGAHSNPQKKKSRAKQKGKNVRS